jgi:arylsulfatase A-like enzyme
MVAAMDEGIGRVMTALRNNGYTDNLITVFLSDNGGPLSEGTKMSCHT